MPRICLTEVISQLFIDSRREEEADVATFGDGLADKGRTDFQRGSIGEPDLFGKGRGLYGITWAGIDEQGMMGENLFGLMPMGEKVPVV